MHEGSNITDATSSQSFSWQCFEINRPSDTIVGYIWLFESVSQKIYWLIIKNDKGVCEAGNPSQLQSHKYWLRWTFW